MVAFTKLILLYDEAGRRAVTQAASGTHASGTYDDANRLTKLGNLKSTGAVISQFDHRYDKAGNRTAILENGGSRTTYSYDNIYQLTAEQRRVRCADRLVGSVLANGPLRR